MGVKKEIGETLTEGILRWVKKNAKDTPKPKKPKGAKRTRVTHYSPEENLDVLDPSRHGTGIAGEEIVRVKRYSGPERSYVYLNDTKPEPGLGPHKYYADIPDHLLYDLKKDPLGLWKKAREDFTIPEKVTSIGTVQAQRQDDVARTAVEELLKQRGYKGYKGSGSSAALFSETPVAPWRRVMSLPSGIDRYDPAQGKYWKLLSPEEKAILRVTPENAPKRVKKTGAYIGGPRGIDSPQKLQDLRARYYLTAEAGQDGWRWYADSSEAIADAAPDRELAARTFGRTSQGAGVDPNTGWGIKGYNQIQAGAPVETGRFPGASQQLGNDPYVDFGPKLEPFSNNLRAAWDSDVSQRPVHDIWDGRAWGYRMANGKEWDAGFSPSQHAFMDSQADVINSALNQNKVGGHDGWDHLSTQAAAWTGQKIRVGDIDPHEAAQHFGSYFDKNTAFVTRETGPGGTTGHFPGLAGNPDLKSEYDRRVRDLLYGESGEDPFTRGMGLMQPTGIDRGVGVWEGEQSPGHIVRALVGAEKGGSAIDPASRELLDASESMYGLINAQDAVAYNKTLFEKATTSNLNTLDLNVGRALSVDEMGSLTDNLAAEFGDEVFPVMTPDGVKIIWNRPADADGKVGAAFKRRIKKAVDETDLPDAEGLFQVNETGFIENDWSKPEGQYGQNYLRNVVGTGRPEIEESANAIAAKYARSRNALDLDFEKEFGDLAGPASEAVLKVREALDKGGLNGLRKLIETGAVPTAFIASLAGILGPENAHAGSVSDLASRYSDTAAAEATFAAPDDDTFKSRREKKKPFYDQLKEMLYAGSDVVGDFAGMLAGELVASGVTAARQKLNPGVDPDKLDAEYESIEESFDVEPRSELGARWSQAAEDTVSAIIGGAIEGIAPAARAVGEPLAPVLEPAIDAAVEIYRDLPEEMKKRLAITTKSRLGLF